jgi:hypothetical protein
MTVRSNGFLGWSVLSSGPKNKVSMKLFDPKMEAVNSFKTSVDFYQAI